MYSGLVYMTAGVMHMPQRKASRGAATWYSVVAVGFCSPPKQARRVAPCNAACVSQQLPSALNFHLLFNRKGMLEITQERMDRQVRSARLTIMDLCLGADFQTIFTVAVGYD